jgi:hypothetical protein
MRKIKQRRRIVEIRERWAGGERWGIKRRRGNVGIRERG